MNNATAPTLPIEALDALRRGYSEPPKVRYDPEGLVLRADDNLDRMSRFVDPARVRWALELGCCDGMVSAGLKHEEARCCALDLSRDGFERRALEARVDFIQADARCLPFGNGVFDLVFSFAAFEHFPDPMLVLEESARVLRTGGFLYLEFGPIGTAPYGLHAYRSIPVPYAHILFRIEDLVEYSRRRELPHDWPSINGWPLSQYRRLFKRVEPDFRVVAYEERPSGGVGAELIIRYPGVFRRVSKNVEDFLVSGILVCLERR